MQINENKGEVFLASLAVVGIFAAFSIYLAFAMNTVWIMALPGISGITIGLALYITNKYICPIVRR